MIDKYCRECFYDFDWNKEYFQYQPKEVKDKKMSAGVSLIVNNNDDRIEYDGPFGTINGEYYNNIFIMSIIYT